MARAAEWAKNNPERRRDHQTTHRLRNLDAVRKRAARHRAKNRDLYRMYEQARRARKSTGEGLSRNLIARLKVWQRGKCACCGEPLGSDFHLDHIVPLKSGGAHSDENMQLLRKTCNLRKGAKDPIDFMQSNGFLL